MRSLMLSSKTAQITTLVLRVLTAVILITSFVLLATVTQEVYRLDVRREVQGSWTMRFYHVVPYRYTAATVVIGALYSVFQIVCGSIGLAKGNDANVMLDFYGEEVMSKLLASGAVAGFLGTAEQVKAWDDAGADKLALDVFMNKTYAANALVLVGFIFSFVLSVLTSYALARNV